jgi:hypothetical protein
MELAGGTAATVDDITAFAFSDRGAFLAMRRYGPRSGGGRGGPTDPVGTTLLVRDLASGVDTTFGDVTDFKWQDKGTHLAMTIGVDNRGTASSFTMRPRTRLRCSIRATPAFRVSRGARIPRT